MRVSYNTATPPKSQGDAHTLWTSVLTAGDKLEAVLTRWLRPNVTVQATVVAVRYEAAGQPEQKC